MWQLLMQPWGADSTPYSSQILTRDLLKILLLIIIAELYQLLFTVVLDTFFIAWGGWKSFALACYPAIIINQSIELQ